jgi:hypothetical protein
MELKMYVPSLLTDFQRFFFDRGKRFFRGFVDQLSHQPVQPV